MGSGGVLRLVRRATAEPRAEESDAPGEGGARPQWSKLQLRPQPNPPNLQSNPPSPLSARCNDSELEAVPAVGGEVEAAPALLIQASPPLCIDRGWK
ncbi:unnamed protein product [Urochloa humidicola]